jgi:hypothetical protein
MPTLPNEGLKGVSMSVGLRLRQSSRTHHCTVLKSLRLFHSSIALRKRTFGTGLFYTRGSRRDASSGPRLLACTHETVHSIAVSNEQDVEELKSWRIRVTEWVVEAPHAPD